MYNLVGVQRMHATTVLPDQGLTYGALFYRPCNILQRVLYDCLGSSSANGDRRLDDREIYLKNRSERMHGRKCRGPAARRAQPRCHYPSS
jgi:hypothetical protein